jgi:enoyl-[acyl-carrier-protein] reductase (NADH)
MVTLSIAPLLRKSMIRSLQCLCTASSRIAYEFVTSTPLKKVATPQDVANQVLILSSNTISGHITGQVVMIEGGMEGRLLNPREEIDLSLV